MKTNLTKFTIIMGFVILNVVFTTALSFAQILLSSPQKIVVDGKRNRLLVSNEGDGAIVQIDSTGHQTYFIQNAGFIDGMEIVGDTVYGVGSNRVVRAYNLVTKQLVMNKTFAGNPNNYLSSICSDSTGNLFISCPDLNCIYRLRIRDTTHWIFSQNNGLNRPNGILLEREKNRIVVIDDSYPPALIHAISLSDSTVSTLDTTTFDRPDGIVKDRLGNYYVGGYYLPGMYRFDPAFTLQPVKIFSGTHMVYPTYDDRDNSLLFTYYDISSWGRFQLPTGINDPGEHLKDFNLYQNYPNPFNPSTVIKYSITENKFVSLKVFDVMGREIKTLVNKSQLAGTYEITFDGSDMPSGVYFYRLETGAFSDSRQMVLIK
jgi:sugar lactone lactonase YvrE